MKGSAKQSKKEKEEGEEEGEEELEEGEEVSQSSGEYVKVSKKGRKDICKICRSLLAKYRCPRCKQRTCSLACTCKHKQIRSCKGYVDATEKVNRTKISENVVKKDYEFVKQKFSQVDKVKKCLTGITNFFQEPKRMLYLKKYAREQLDMKIHQAPPIIERHRENISFFYMKTKQIFWVVEILYYEGSRLYERSLAEPTADSQPILAILPSQFLSRQLLLHGINTQNKNEFKVYVEDRRENNREVFEVGQQITLRNCLRGRNVYEFPTLFAVHSTLNEQFLKQHKP